MHLVKYNNFKQIFKVIILIGSIAFISQLIIAIYMNVIIHSVLFYVKCAYLLLVPYILFLPAIKTLNNEYKVDSASYKTISILCCIVSIMFFCFSYIFFYIETFEEPERNQVMSVVAMISSYCALCSLSLVDKDRKDKKK